MSDTQIGNGAPKKRRMGGPSQPVESSAEKVVTDLAPTVETTGAPIRTRMGGAVVQFEQQSSPTQPTENPMRTRMGGRAPAASEHPAQESDSVEGAVHPTSKEVSLAGSSSVSRQINPMGNAQVAPVTPEPITASLPTSTASVPTTTALIAIGKLKEARNRRYLIGSIVLVVIGIVAVLISRWLVNMPNVQQFMGQYPGFMELPQGAPEGLPAWLNWQHYLNIFFMVLIVRTGIQVRTEKKVPAYWMAQADSFFSPKSSTPKKVSLTQWVHQSLDIFWTLNGVVFVILLFVTGQWMRIVPTSWEVIPNAISAFLQYLSLNWPLENGWVHYNSLQVIAYFVTVFIAAPLAIITGIRFSTWWPDKNEKLSKAYPIELARKVHFPVMVYFLIFTAIHVFLVFFTGALRNLNHMFTARDLIDWWGLIIFAISLIVIAAAWWLTKPVFMRTLAAKFGTLTK